MNKLYLITLLLCFVALFFGAAGSVDGLLGGWHV
jgi:hypothetical protein